jgi:hypothetical protein
MKNIQSIEEGKWFELVPVEFTESERTILFSNDEQDIIAKEALLEKIKTDGKKSISAAIASKAKAKYNEIKPSLKSTDVYELISADFILDDTNITFGILNCRVNGEHKQVRF